MVMNLDDIARKFQEISISNQIVYPSIEELTGISDLHIRKNITQGPYASVVDYVDIQFKLLRADFILPISGDMKDLSIRKTYDNIIIHKDVKFVHHDIYKNYFAYRIKLKEKKLYNEINGSLLIFSRNNFKTALFGKFLENNIVYFEKKIDINFNDSYTLVECNSFFEPYYNSLMYLKQLNSQNFPMKDYIVGVEKKVKKPAYTNDTFELCLTSKKRLLNKSQYNAFRGALLNEFALVQGPPGTGKTFLGVEIVRTLVQYKHLWQHKGPILVVCYTNHALDQFLEKLLPVTTNIIRLGGNHDNKSLEPFRFHNVRMQEEHSTRISCGKEIKGLIEEIDSLKYQIRLCDTDICYEQSLFGVMEIDQVILWLLFEDDKNDQLQLAKTLSLYRRSSSRVQSDRSLLGRMLTVQKLIQRRIAKLEKECLTQPQLFLWKMELSFITEKTKLLQKLINQRGKFGMKNFSGEKLRKLSSAERWMFVNYAMEVIKRKSINLLTETSRRYRIVYASYDEERKEQDIKLMRSKLIIGMTTTAASRINSKLERVRCPIVIVEEAAEVLEAHIVSSLTKNCQHLILIGDHQQLQPKTADQNIGERYGLSISMFERMIMNNIPYYTLNVQRRMRPEISSLITPSIYPELIDDDVVKNYGGIRGLHQPVCFINHNKPEENDKNSKHNLYEAKFLMKVVNHLIMNGYKCQEITVIAAYSAQVDVLQRELEEYPKEYSNVVITTIDNYQGEQNRIILLSLVRNNARRSIGFLRTSNRVCVALSRAQEGLIIMGNMDLLSSKSRLWKEVQKKLSAQNAISDYLMLKCERHSTLQLVERISDFVKAPLGGCSENCRQYFECGHRCWLKCHFSVNDHKEECKKCQEKEEINRLKYLNHSLPKKLN